MRALAERIERAGMQDQFGQILVPIEEVVEVKTAASPSLNAVSSLATCWSKWR